MMINPTKREIYLSRKCMGWYTYNFDTEKTVLRDDAPEEIREADREIREIRNKRIPDGFE